MSEPTEIVVEATEEEEDVPATGHEIVHHQNHGQLAVRRELSVDEVVAQVEKIQEIAKKVMKPGVHYGVVPGVEKPGLSKAGAEILNLTFWMAPRYRVTKTYEGDHLTVDVVAELYHRDTGNFLGEGVGLCTTKEEKYAFRMAGRTCPDCGQDAIIKGKEEYGGGWLCFKKKGGCGAKWADSTAQAAEFATAEIGKVPNEKLADSHNTVVKIGKKRALVDAVLTSTAAGDVFTQDVEEGHVQESSSGEASASPSGDAAAADGGPQADASPEQEPPAATGPGAGDPVKAAQGRVTRMKNLASAKGAVRDDDEFERIVSNHMAQSGLGYIEKAWVEEQIKLLEGMPDAQAAA